MTEQRSEKTEENEKKRTSLIVNGLFISNWLFITFLRKQFFAAPHGGAMFVVRNIGTILATLALTVAMSHFLPKRACLIAIPVTLCLALIAAIF